MAEAWPLLLWFLAIPPRLEQTWTVPRWARTQLAGSMRGLVGWMDGCLGMGLLACTPILLFLLFMLLLSSCGLALTTFVFRRICPSAPCGRKCAPSPVSFTCFLLGCRYCVIVGNVHLSVLVQIKPKPKNINSGEKRLAFRTRTFSKPETGSTLCPLTCGDLLVSSGPGSRAPRRAGWRRDLEGDAEERRGRPRLWARQSPQRGHQPAGCGKPVGTPSSEWERGRGLTSVLST